ncbi:MAG TPA: cytochrome b N-terminal domain-containing protein [Candidatus Angelobacter sp.]|jgi:quinol-cytochrome oxidoreductase complex cytochrome b subunit|nr:cytochrome b N-terminal domain-containing protein [Candidatus Angelobacter sp.]
MDQPAPYVHWGFILISLPNLVLILVMVGIFVLALVAPFPFHRREHWADEQPAALPEEPEAAPSRSWTLAVRGRIAHRLPLTELLPDRQPYYVGSWVYVFGVVSIAALVWVVVSGVILVLFGPQWWHVSPQGRFVNSLHFWSVQMFFIFMVLHLWGQYWGAGWRHGRASTWMTGVVVFLAGIVTAFTGYIAQQNFDAQWIAVNAKDAINASGIGAFFNPLNFGQMYGLHVMLLPIAVTLLVILHVVQVRMRGVVRPIDDDAEVAAQ